MNQSLLKNWIKLVASNKAPLKSHLGTSVWSDGVECLNRLDLTSFLKPRHNLSQDEKYALDLLAIATNEKNQGQQTWVSGHSTLLLNSPYYRKVNSASSTESLKYEFVDEDVGDFSPWTNRIVLGKKFYSRVDGQIRIPFYTYNHENSHLTLFKNIYTNIDLPDEKMFDLFILAEWFCISADLLLAYDLQRANLTGCFRELCRVPNNRQIEGAYVFVKNCRDITTLNSYASEFRNAILRRKKQSVACDLVSKASVDFHKNYITKVLLPRARSNVASPLPAAKAEKLLKDLKELSFTGLVRKLTGADYDK